MIWSLSARSAIAATLVLSLLAVACGPTANAIKPTLPPRSIQPAQSVDAAVPSPQQTLEPGASPTTVPSGIAQPMASFPQGAAYEVTGVTTTPTGFLAIGFAGTGNGYFGLHQGVTWTSTDGLTWQQQIDPAFLDVSPEYVETIGSDVYVFGYFSTCAEVIDAECTDDPNAGNVIFRSANGGPWEQLAQTTDMIKAEIVGVTTWQNNLVQWGEANDDNLTATVWTTADALTWTTTTDLAGLDPIDAVGAGGPGLVAFGSTYLENIEASQLQAASSTDGAHFTSAIVPPITEATINEATAGPGGMVAIGYGYPLSDEAPSLGLTIFSSDGVNWTQATASDGTFEQTEINDVHSSSSGYVTVGSTVNDLDMTLQGGRVWTSADGKTWRSPGDFGGVFSQYGASVLGPNGLIVFTANEEDTDTGDDINSTIYGWFIPNSELTP